MKTDIAKHTETPWRVGAVAGWDDKKHTMNIVTKNGCHIAKTDGSEHLSKEEKEANAEFIVRAVNNHEDLKRRLSATATELHHALNHSGEMSVCESPRCFGNSEAIAKAERP